MSIEINISNYESYLLSYIDGELNEAEQAALEVFLKKHPQFRQELELLEGTRLVPDEQLVFDNKAALYRTASPAAVDYEELMLGIYRWRIDTIGRKDFTGVPGATSCRANGAAFVTGHKVNTGYYTGICG